MLTGEPVEIARQLREKAERTIRPRGRAYPDRAHLVGDTGLLNIKRAEQKANEGGRSIPGPPDDRSNNPH